ncbi:MAG: flagellar protein FlgN [Nitrospirae bacterium]|nr:MAG: flagellar protein FlgN [Nitrospirota bacterium]
MDHTAVWQDLLATLRTEQDTYCRLSALLDEEHGLLRRMDHHGLLEVTGRKEPLLHDLRRYEQRRTLLLQTLLGPKPHVDPSKWVIELDQAPSPFGPRASTAFRKLLAVAKTVAEQGRRNAFLTYRGLSMVREALRLIYAGESVQPVYRGSGELALPAVTSSLSIRG